jgi:hypothetical protein
VGVGASSRTEAKGEESPHSWRGSVGQFFRALRNSPSCPGWGPKQRVKQQKHSGLISISTKTFKLRKVPRQCINPSVLNWAVDMCRSPSSQRLASGARLCLIQPTYTFVCSRHETLRFGFRGQFTSREVNISKVLFPLFPHLWGSRGAVAFQVQVCFV